MITVTTSHLEISLVKSASLVPHRMLLLCIGVSPWYGCWLLLRRFSKYFIHSFCLSIRNVRINIFPFNRGDAYNFILDVTSCKYSLAIPSPCSVSIFYFPQPFLFFSFSFPNPSKRKKKKASPSHYKLPLQIPNGGSMGFPSLVLSTFASATAIFRVPTVPVLLPMSCLLLSRSFSELCHSCLRLLKIPRCPIGSTRLLAWCLLLSPLCSGTSRSCCTADWRSQCTYSIMSIFFFIALSWVLVWEKKSTSDVIAFMNRHLAISAGGRRSIEICRAWRTRSRKGPWMRKDLRGTVMKYVLTCKWLSFNLSTLSFNRLWQ